jgi:hypothetical protein
MIELMILLGIERHVRHRLCTMWLISAVILSPAWLSTAQASVALKAISLPQTVMRSVIVDKSTWQGVAVELERLQSPATLAATLEQLATLLPEVTPVWSEQGVMQAHWTSAETSYALLLWETESHATEGLLSGLALAQPLSVGHNALSAQFEARDWLPRQSQQLFRLHDQSGAQPIALSSFTVLTTSSQLVDHLNAAGRRNNWIRLPGELNFFRNNTRLSFQVMTDTGQTTVLVYETSRGAP